MGLHVNGHLWEDDGPDSPNTCTCEECGVTVNHNVLYITEACTNPLVLEPLPCKHEKVDIATYLVQGGSAWERYCVVCGTILYKSDTNEPTPLI